MPFYLEQRPNDYFHEFLTVPQWYVHIFFEIRFEQIQLTIGWLGIHFNSWKTFGWKWREISNVSIFYYFSHNIVYKIQKWATVFACAFAISMQLHAIPGGVIQNGYIKCNTTYWRGDWIELLEKLAGSWNFLVSVTENTCFKKVTIMMPIALACQETYIQRTENCLLYPHTKTQCYDKNNKK